MTDALLLAAFSLRVAGLRIDQIDREKAQNLHFKSFQTLSCAAPLIWLKLVGAPLPDRSV